MNPDREETFLTVADVADWLKLNQQTVRNWIDQGRLPAVRVGRRVRIKRSDLDQILDAGYRGGGTALVRPSGPSAEDFWSGEPVGDAQPDPAADVSPFGAEAYPATSAAQPAGENGAEGGPAVAEEREEASEA